MKLIPLLLADPSPCLRLLVFKELLNRSDDDQEIQDLTQIRNSDPLIKDLFNLQGSDGSWKSNAIIDSSYADEIRVSATILTRLGYMGFNNNHPHVKKGVEYLFSMQNDDGAWPIPIGPPQQVDGGYDMIPLQTSFPLRAIAACGYSTDKRAELGYEWLLDQCLEDGAWPSGTKAGTKGFVAGYRKLPHSRWGCRTNTTAALAVLALHPKRRNNEPARKALDLLLARETKERHIIGFEVARLIGVEPFRGYFTHFARFDLAFILDLCWKIGANREDQRVKGIIDFVLESQGQFGLWEYIPHPQTSRWVTFDILRSLSRLDDSTDWLSFEPRTPFQAYPKKPSRF